MRRNQRGGLTFELSDESGRTFLKWGVAGADRLRDEAARLTWASDFSRVPRVLEVGEGAVQTWLMTEALEGEHAVATQWIADPKRAVTALGEGLRQFHESLHVPSCPFSWSVTDRLDAIHQRAARGEIDIRNSQVEHRDLSLESALNRLESPPPVDSLVVCHGDACAPNTLLDVHGRVSGHVDLGALGIADRWADLAIAPWSTTWNYGPGWESLLLDAYKFPADPERIDHYRLLWDLGP